MSSKSIVVRCPWCRKREMVWVEIDPNFGPDHDVRLVGQCGLCRKPIRLATTVRQIRVKNVRRTVLRMERGV